MSATWFYVDIGECYAFKPQLLPKLKYSQLKKLTVAHLHYVGQKRVGDRMSQVQMGLLLLLLMVYLCYYYYCHTIRVMLLLLFTISVTIIIVTISVSVMLSFV